MRHTRSSAKKSVSGSEHRSSDLPIFEQRLERDAGFSSPSSRLYNNIENQGGFFNGATNPVLTIRSGDTINQLLPRRFEEDKECPRCKRPSNPAPVIVKYDRESLDAMNRLSAQIEKLNAHFAMTTVNNLPDLN